MRHVTVYTKIKRYLICQFYKMSAVTDTTRLGERLWRNQSYIENGYLHGHYLPSCASAALDRVNSTIIHIFIIIEMSVSSIHSFGLSFCWSDVIEHAYRRY
jgi:hypothetical protein